MSELEQAEKDNINELENQELDDDGLELTNQEKRELENLTHWNDLERQGQSLERNRRILDRKIRKCSSGDQIIKYVECQNRLVQTIVKLAYVVDKFEELWKVLEEKTATKKIDHRYNAQPTNMKDFDASRFEER